MAWLFFIDESGHDHRNTPYEVRGGLAMHVGQLWPFVRQVQRLEAHCFGCRLHDYGKEIKGSTLVDRKRFKFAGQGEFFRTTRGECSADPSSRRTTEVPLRVGPSSRPMAKPACTWPGTCLAS